MDTGLSDEFARLIFERRSVVEAGMHPAPVIEALNVVEDGASRLRPGVKRDVVEPFGLEQVEEALDRRVVVAVARAAHAADDPVLVEDVLVLGAGVRPAAVAVMHEPRCRTSRANRCGEGLEREGLRRTGVGGPT